MVLDYAPEARLVFSCGWHITRDGQDVYSRGFLWLVKAFAWLGWLARVVEIDDQVEACRRIFESDTRWTVVRGSGLEDDALIHEAPAIVGCQTPSALAHTTHT